MKVEGTMAGGRTDGADGRERFFLDWPAWLARLLRLSSKLVRVRYIRFPDLENGEPTIFALWHCEDLSLLPYFGRYHPRILVSQSRDGAILSRAVSVLGFDASRGSSSRGGARGVLALKRSLKAGQSVVFAADGPRGPRQVAKPGAVYLAAKTGCPICVAGTASSFRYVLRGTWSKTGLPLPGSKMVVAFSPLIHLPPEAAHWPTHVQSRFLSVAISDAVREAEVKLARWQSGGS